MESCSLQGIEAIRLDDNEGVVIDETKCVRCGQCVLSCPLSFPDKTVRHLRDMLDCGLCPYARPLGAVAEKDDVRLAVEALNNKSKYLIVQIAPSVRATIGEEFCMEPGEQTIGKLYTAFRRLGFHKALDTNFAADLTVVEEGTEFLERLQKGGVTPMFTSCCPAWVKFVESNYPQLVGNLSTAKSPQQMLGAAAKTALAARLGVEPSDMFIVSIMPCTAKKYERARCEMTSASKYWAEKHENIASDVSEYPAANSEHDQRAYPDVDAVLTTRECAKLLKLYGINLAATEESGPDEMLAEYSGAAAIFGRTGGVMTAALRTAYELATGMPLPDIELAGLGATQGIKTATIPLPTGSAGLKENDHSRHVSSQEIKTAVISLPTGSTGLKDNDHSRHVSSQEIIAAPTASPADDATLKVAVASGLQNARKICEDIIAGGEFSKYHFIEVMSCPGGCVGGGGQSIATNKIKVAGRTEGLNSEDRGLKTRKSHENASVKQLYESFFGKPCSHLSHRLLHTYYGNSK